MLIIHLTVVPENYSYFYYYEKMGRIRFLFIADTAR